MGNLTKKLLIIGSSQGCYGGIEAFMIALAEAASQWPEYEVKLCFKLVKNASADLSLTESASKSCTQVYFVKRGSKELIQLIKWADILHVQNTPPDVIFTAGLLAKKIVLTVHNRRMPELNLHNLVWGLSIKLVHRRWFNSNFVWNTWEPKTKSAKSSSIPTVCLLPKKSSSLNKRKGFLFIGRWIENKGIEEILEAYALIGFDHHTWPLTILGNGPLEHKITALAAKLGLKHVQMPGFVTDETKQQYLSETRWLLAPAKTQEDLGLTPIEARSAGVPAIVTNDGGLPESGGPAALIAERGSVIDLARCMTIAATMDDEEYLIRATLSRTSLDDFLKPMSFYRDSYGSLV